MNLINELRMLAEDLHVNGYNRYSAAMSKAADEIAKWEAVFGHLGGTPDECGNAIIAARDELEAAEKDIALKERVIDSLGLGLNAAAHERDNLRAKIESMEKQEPVGVLHVGSYYGEELQDWEFEANQGACDKLNEAYISNPTSLPLYALPGAQPAPSIRPAALFPVIAWLRNGCDPMKAADELEMLAEAPEAKP